MSKADLNGEEIDTEKPHSHFDPHSLDFWYLVVVIISAIMMAVLFGLILSDRANLRREANIRATQIQQQRYDTTYTNCIDTNERHQQAIDKLNDLFKQAEKGKSAAEKAQIEQSRNENVALINALVPFRNCKAVARAAVHPLPAPNQENH